MKRLMVGLSLCLLVPVVSAQTPEQKANKEALKALQEYIGGWKGSGSPVKPNPPSKELWNEEINFGWRFKGEDAWITLEIKNGRYYKAGELRFLPKTKMYELTMTDVKNEKLVFEGEVKNEYLTFEREDPKTKETQKLTMNLAGDGVRFIYRYDRKREGSTVFIKDYMVASTKIGETLGSKEKKNECVVSGGTGTSTVSHKGETFWVCCSGCRDAFVENPEKYIKEFKAKKGMK